MTIWSHSRLSTFEQCPRKYAFKYIEKPEIEEERTIEAFLGRLVHESLEQLCRDLQMGRGMSEEDLLKDFSDRWQKEWSPEIRIVRTQYSAQHYRSLGERCLKDYHKRYHPFDQDRTLGVEVPVALSLDPEGRYRIRGFIDRLAKEADGFYSVIDYKTGNHVPSQQDLSQDRQLALYQIAVQEMYPDAKKVRLVWHYLAYDLTLDSARSRSALETLKRGMIALIDRVEATKTFEPRESALCDWCEYRSLCPLKCHQARVEALPQEAFAKDDGVALVNRLAEAKASLTQARREADRQEEPLKAEIEGIEQALVSYAQEHGLKAVQGSGQVARVIEREGWRFPGRNDEGRDGLEQALRKTGLLERFSELDTKVLAKTAEAGELPPEAMTAIAPFGERVQETRVTLRTIHDGKDRRMDADAIQSSGMMGTLPRSTR